METRKMKIGNETIEIRKVSAEEKLPSILKSLHTIYALSIVNIYKRFGDGVFEEIAKVWKKMGRQAGEEMRKYALKKTGKKELGILDYCQYGPNIIEGMGLYEIGLQTEFWEISDKHVKGIMRNCPFLAIWKDAGIRDEAVLKKLCASLYPFDEAFITTFSPKLRVVYSCDKPGYCEGKDYCEIFVEEM